MINKDTFLAARDCAYGAWHSHRADGATAPTPGESLRMWQGQEIHRLARQRYPDGVPVTCVEQSAAAAETEAPLAAGGPAVVFEALITAAPLVARPDILIRDGDGWRLVEVKSSLNLKAGLIDDMAYTLMVLNRAGITVTDSSLLLLSRDYRKNAPAEHLFVSHPATEESKAAAGQLEAERAAIVATLLAAGPPPAVPCSACRQCGLEIDECPVRQLEHPVYELPGLREKKIAGLVGSGVHEIKDVPDDFSLSADQELVRRAVVENRPWTSPSLGAALARVQWPAYYLDFETVSTALPLYDGVEPWTQVPTQFSVHVCDRPGHVVDHQEFLGDPLQDPRRALACELIRVLGTGGSVIVYSGFEGRILGWLQEGFTELSSQLAAIQGRLVDLCEIVKKAYRHPDFCGSLSIKRTLPVMVPDMSYDNLNIAEGDTASAVYALMALGRIGADQLPQRRADLLEYCKQDTLAMVRIHQVLDGLASGAAAV